MSESSFSAPVPPAGPIDDVDVVPAPLHPVWSAPPQDDLPGVRALSVVIGRSPATVVSLETARLADCPVSVLHPIGRFGS